MSNVSKVNVDDRLYDIEDETARQMIGDAVMHIKDGENILPKVDGVVLLPNMVKTINRVAPDASGNVAVTIEGTTIALLRVEAAISSTDTHLVTLMDARIHPGMDVVEYNIEPATAQASAISVRTEAGKLTIEGAFSSACTVALTLGADGAVQMAEDRAYAQRMAFRHNLIDNPWFTVNQRGQDRYEGSTVGRVYTADRWIAQYDGTLDITNNGVTLRNTGSSDGYMVQYLPDLPAGTLTMSVRLSSGEIISATSAGNIETTDMLLIRENNRIAIPIASGSSKAIRAVKLEVGDVSTLGNDSTPDPSEILTACQKYYYPGDSAIVAAHCFSGNGLIVNTGIKMRKAPRKESDPLVLYNGQWQDLAILQRSYRQASGNIILQYSPLTGMQDGAFLLRGLPALSADL